MPDDGTSTAAVIAVVIGVCGVFGLAAGMIAYMKIKTVGTFIGLFLLGALLPIVGLVVAVMMKPLPQPAWYPDPWQQANYRWHDGQNWTGQTA